MELNELGIGSVEEDGFILDVKLSTIDKAAIPQDRFMIVSNTALQVKEAIIYIMNGLFAYKEVYSTIYVNVFGVVYSVSLRKYATSNSDDLMKCFTMLKTALVPMCGQQTADTLTGMVLAEIKSGNFMYLK